jgi:hypothetical protein
MPYAPLNTTLRPKTATSGPNVDYSSTKAHPPWHRPAEKMHTFLHVEFELFMVHSFSEAGFENLFCSLGF